MEATSNWTCHVRREEGTVLQSTALGVSVSDVTASWTAREQGTGSDYKMLSALYATDAESALAESLLVTLQNSFDPNDDTLPIEEFEPLVRELLAAPSRLGSEWELQPSTPLTTEGGRS